LLTLAEGADATDVTESLADGGAAVAANFWSGFAQTLDPAEDPSQWSVEVGEEISDDGETFVAVRDRYRRGRQPHLLPAPERELAG
jgi:hypothetical protein